MVGEVSAPEELYASADVVILPTRREGLPYVPLEAGAMGVPVIASDIPACREIVVDGLTGKLFAVGDTGELAKAIVEYVDNKEIARAHGKNGRERVCRLFSKTAIMAAWVVWLDRIDRETCPEVI
ncbi:MAG: hypothetical protein BroJett038_33240 [Chloroflexota bacterium]|nr:MAG: hypothetical protein BroJett038_33240 [Chloroflexota bacterium]